MDELNRKRAWVLRATALEFRYSDCQPNVEVIITSVFIVNRRLVRKARETFHFEINLF